MKRGQRYPPEVRSQEEVERLLDACGRSFTGRRNRTLLVLLWRCGLRLSEALALEPRDVDLRRGTLHVRNGKGGRSRYVGLDGRAAAEAEAWLRGRPPDARTLICTTRGTPVQTAYVRNLLRRLAARAGEGRALELRDVDLRRGTLHVRHGKGGRARYVGLRWASRC